MVMEINGVFYNFKKIRGETNKNYNIRVLNIINSINLKGIPDMVKNMKEINNQIYGCKY